MLDEYYQTFVSGRSGEFRDVLIDNIGIISELILIYLLGKLMKLKRGIGKSRLT